MLLGLSIRDLVLVKKLDLSFAGGLCALTGETGAGKSILLDALGLALGARADQRLVRQGCKQASVTAVFALGKSRTLLAAADEAGLDPEALQAEGALVLRRVQGTDGRSRAFVNDQPVSVALLRRFGDLLVEIQGQFEQRGLLDAGSHRGVLDVFGGLEKQAAALARLWQSWRDVDAAYAEAEGELARARRDEDFLRHSLDELEELAPTAGEQARLAEERAFLKHRERLAQAAEEASLAIGGDGTSPGADAAIGRARSRIEAVTELAAGRCDEILAALERAAAELGEADAALRSLLDAMQQTDNSLESVETRYYAFLELARKHHCEADELPARQRQLKEQLALLDLGEGDLKRLAAERAETWQAYLRAAEDLSQARRKAAGRLDRATAAELPPLKLDKARFVTTIEQLPEEAWGPAGFDRIAFHVATLPGQPPGPIAKIASGGELARFLLALKVVLAAVHPEQTLVFDEVDAGIGGATADAVGEMLARLAAERQVLVVTHSPQVAARAGHHLLVTKSVSKDAAATLAEALSLEGRREEIARMLSGAEVTQEARAAAARLMGAA